jgi:TolB protein
VIASNGTGLARLATGPGFDSDPAWSSTGRIAFASRRQGEGDLYVINEDGTNELRLTTSAGDDDGPSWSPDGTQIVFRSSRDGNAEIYVMNADGTGARRLTSNPAADHQPAWSSTGKIAFVTDRDQSGGEIYVMNEDGSDVVRLTHNLDVESSPAWSPDGSMIAFARPDPCYFYYGYYCGWNLFVMNADGTNQRRLATASGIDLRGNHPSWSPTGTAIAFTLVACPFYCDPPAVYIANLQGGQPTLIATDGANPVWTP